MGNVSSEYVVLPFTIDYGYWERFYDYGEQNFYWRFKEYTDVYPVENPLDLFDIGSYGTLGVFQLIYEGSKLIKCLCMGSVDRLRQEAEKR